MHGNVKYFVFFPQVFYNLVNILDFGADNNVTVKVKSRNSGFPAASEANKSNCTSKNPSLYAPHLSNLSGDWERCVGDLFGHAGYTECLRFKFGKYVVQTSTSTTLASSGTTTHHHDAKAKRLATQIFLKSGTFAML
jgi:hypothetical protein